MVAHLAIIFRGYQNLLDKNGVFFLKKTQSWQKFNGHPHMMKIQPRDLTNGRVGRSCIIVPALALSVPL